MYTKSVNQIGVVCPLTIWFLLKIGSVNGCRPPGINGKQDGSQENVYERGMRNLTCNKREHNHTLRCLQVVSGGAL